MSWEDKVRKVIPYTPGEQPRRTDIIKLNTNECPYPPSPKVAEALAAFDEDRLRLYPDPAAAELVNALAAYYRVDSNQVFVGVGSDDVLAMAFLTFFTSGKPILFPDVTYSFYEVWAELFGISYEKCPLKADFGLDAEDYLKDNGGIIIANPNAPTGVMESTETIEKIIAANQDSVVIVDEAYVDFGGKSVIELVERYENLLVVQTFSKSRAMAGMRIGFAIGSPKLIAYLNDAKFSFNSYTMNHLTISCGKACVEDDVYFKEITSRIVATRERVKGQLSQLGFLFPDSMTNFIFATHPKVNAEELFLALKEEGIYVRYFKKPRIDGYLRITIGTDAQMDALITFLQNYMKNRS